MTIEGRTPTAWGAAGASNSSGFLPGSRGGFGFSSGDLAWEPLPRSAQQQHESPSGGKQLAVRRLALSAADLWASLSDADRRRRLLAPGGGGGRGGGLEPMYVYLDVTVRFSSAAALTAAPGTHPSRGGRPSAAVVGGAVAASVAAALLVVVAALFVSRARRGRRAGGGAGEGKDGLPTTCCHHGSCHYHGHSHPLDGSCKELPPSSFGRPGSGIASAGAGSFLDGRVRSDTAPHGSGGPSGPLDGAARTPASSAPLVLGGLAAAAANQRLEAWRRAGSTGRGSSTQGPGEEGEDGREGAQQRQQFESAARAVQQLHQGSEWRHTQEDLVLESVLGEGTFGMVRAGGGRVGRWSGGLLLGFGLGVKSCKSLYSFARKQVPTDATSVSTLTPPGVSRLVEGDAGGRQAGEQHPPLTWAT